MVVRISMLCRVTYCQCHLFNFVLVYLFNEFTIFYYCMLNRMIYFYRLLHTLVLSHYVYLCLYICIYDVHTESVMT